MASAASPSRVHSELRPRRSRCKTGCSCCRLRRKKCDEKRPRCIACERLDLICSWPDANEFTWRIRMGLSTHSQPAKVASATPDTASLITTSPATSDEFTTISTADSEIQSPESYRYQGASAPSPPCLSRPGLSPLPHQSQWLLQLYFERTSSSLVVLKPEATNPFIYTVLPWAFNDDLIMNTVLVLGGSFGSSLDGATEEQSLVYYGRAIRQFKPALTAWSGSSLRETLRLLLVTLFLCLSEMYRGNRHGTLFHHLRACRHFAQAAHDALKRRETIDREDCELAHLLLEAYAFGDLSCSIRLLPDVEDTKAARDSQVLRLETIREFETASANFGCTWELFKLVPGISELARRKKDELEKGQDLGCFATYSDLKHSIDLWRSNIQVPALAVLDHQEACVAAGLLACGAITLFSHTAYHHNGHSYLRAVAEPLVEEAIKLVHICGGSPWSTFAYWPTVTIASFATTESQQMRSRNWLSCDLHIVKRAKEILQWVWDAPDDVYGLSGLATVIAERNTSWCC